MDKTRQQLYKHKGKDQEVNSTLFSTYKTFAPRNRQNNEYKFF